MFSDVFWLFLLLETFVMGFEPLGCPESHLMKYYCQNDFAMKVLFRKRFYSHIPYNGKPYRMVLLNLYKGNVTELAISYGKFIKIQTHENLLKQKGQEYLIFVSKKNKQDGDIYADKCLTMFPWGWLTSVQKKGVSQQHYALGCPCADEISDYDRSRRCDYNYAFMRPVNGECKYVTIKKSTLYKKCRLRYRSK